EPEGGDSFHLFSIYEDGVWSCLIFLKSMISSFVLWILRVRLFPERQRDSFSTSALYAVSSPSLMRPTTVLWYLIMRLVGWIGEQSYVLRVYSRGLETQP
ncbi:hypothetical protein GOODEAATRI_014824, partial [Goodea atripinnis]